MKNLAGQDEVAGLLNVLHRLDEFGEEIDRSLATLEDRVAAQEEVLIDLAAENRRLRQELRWVTPAAPPG